MRSTLVRLSFAALLLLLLIASVTRAADPTHHPAATTTTQGGSAHAALADPHHRPVLPARSPLPGTMMIVILGLFFLPAAIVGPMVGYHAPEEVPDASSHDEHGHGAHDAHGHGHGHVSGH